MERKDFELKLFHYRREASDPIYGTDENERTPRIAEKEIVKIEVLCVKK